ncbi:SusC/RagA family TonB-linked outer membrane protein [Bacteroides graminisolvens]
MKLKLFFLVNVLFLGSSLLSAQILVKGTVKDRQGSAIPGVTVKVLDKDVMVVTGLEGQYAISVPPRATLEFSFVGMNSQKIELGNRTYVDVVMSDLLTELDEVVVTAVGIKQQKKKLGYTTQQLQAQTIEESHSLNLGNALSGQIAGLNVTNPTGLFQAPSFSLRGKTPLIVVDGIPIESDMFDIPNEDVESINVLKGTSASALYGSRGKNGAILIMTKKAKKEGLEVAVSLSSMVSAGFTVFPETQNQYGSGSEGKYEFWDGADGGISDGDMTWGPKFVPGLLVKQWNSPIRNKATGETIDWWGNVKGSVYDDRSLYERVPIAFEQHDNLKEFMRTGIITKANFSVAHKGKSSNTFVSGNYANQRGQVPNTSVNTGGITFNHDYDLSNNLKFTLNLSYNKVYSPNYPRYGYGPKNHMYTIMLWMSDDVDIRELKKHMYRPDKEGYVQANYNYAWYNNPYFMAYEFTQEHNRDVLNGQAKVIWDVTPEFSVQGRTSARSQTLFEDMNVPKSYMNYGDSRNGDYKDWNTRQLNVDADVLATYSHAFSRNLALTVNGGISSFYRRYQSEYQSTDGLIVPRVYNLSNSQGPVTATNKLQEKAINSVYGTANLDVYNAFFLTVTGRNDWSSTLPKGNNSYFYPSVAVSTLLSEYIKMPKYIDYLKAHASWAVVSSDLDPYSIVSTYSNSTLYGATPSVSYPSALKNSDIKPQKTTSYEAGLATSFANNRASLELTYYHVVDENQIIDLPISEASGYTSRKVNGNVSKTNGLELVLGVVPIKRKKFSWSLTTNWTTSIRKLTEVYGDMAKYGNLKVGDRMDAIYATVWQKSADGKLILGANGMPIKDSYVAKVGNADPDVRFGFQNVFKIDKFRVNVDFDGAIGGTLISTTHQKMWWAGKHPNSVTWRDAEYAAGKPVYVPQGVVVTGGELVRDVNSHVTSDSRTYKENTTAVSWQTWCQNYPYRAAVTEEESEEFANTFKRTFLKLRRISVSYDLTNVIGKKHFKGLDVTLFGNNLFVLKKMPYLDPDFGPTDGDLQDPSSRYIGISATAKF